MNDKELNRGASPQAIATASQALGIKFPRVLQEIWLTANGLNLPGGWCMYPVYDPQNPHLTSKHIVYENTLDRWDKMVKDLIVIAHKGSSNHLVLKKNGHTLATDIYHWDQATNKITEWVMGLKDILAQVQKQKAKMKKSLPNPDESDPGR